MGQIEIAGVFFTHSLIPLIGPFLFPGRKQQGKVEEGRRERLGTHTQGSDLLPVNQIKAVATCKP